MMKKTRKIILLLLTLIITVLSACAPGAHVRVGVGAQVPNAWAGPYPYPPAERPVTVGKPYSP